MAKKKEELDQFVQRFSNELLYPFDPMLQKTIKKLIEKRKEYKSNEQLKNVNVYIAFILYCAIALGLMVNDYLDQIISLNIGLYAFLALLLGTHIIYTKNLKNKTDKKKNEYDTLRFYVMEIMPITLRHQDERNKLANYLNETHDVNIYHP
jgi:undecaprenyl pyrophosphate phosphatase UppP